MEAINILTSQAVPLLNDNIDTDQLIPKTYLKRIEKTGFGEFLFDDWRYLRDRTPNPEFILNDPVYKKAQILVTGDNFGSGSSREHAAWALLDYGFKVIIAGSFSDIFYMNATKNGVLPIVLDKQVRQELVSDPTKEVTVDLDAQTVTYNGNSYTFDIDPTWKHKLINGLDEIAITLQYENEIAAYEKKQQI
ncbi:MULTISPECIES: 3-isopropylmalate dehydratase small subunit [Enterococcus]|uniref:3-isopropylmalate dehydratase small subunit n=1 Tax=Enterococcus sulfureus ATCC 49903 TaxID=1140003 RepID=S0LDM0_9ENTE|nr:3-isopropylmalate dehydratase small subunit [Enterococcus sulfureus]EOT51415.1 3-isopropylmalate dehydratase, small subunit [Enterococcus sulfureus ATCC 49903]EOT87072.1 3-isopropylmalate dehydratase, small subunit [Enterococcus sulfureus ATCC 49903]